MHHRVVKWFARGGAGAIGRAALAIGALVTSGCVLQPVDLEGRQCPCAEGWSCVSGTCVRPGERAPDAGLDAGDASHDGALPDAQPLDTGVVWTELDAGAIDAGVIDAGLDAGALDAGTDAGTFDAGLDAGTFDAGLDAGPFDAGTDAGPPDAGTPDAGPGNTRCDDIHAGAIFCDGFEWVHPGGRMHWQRDDVMNGTVTTVTTPTPYLGQRALRAQTNAGDGNRASVEVVLGTAYTSGDLWLRAMHYVPASVSVTSLSLLYIGVETGAQGIAIQSFEGGRIGAWVGTDGTMGSWHPTTALLPRDEWVCLEMRIGIADTGGDGQVELYVNGTQVGRFTGLDTLPAALGGLRLLKTGIEFQTGGQQGATIYTDEVVLSRSRVRCL